MSGLFDGIDMVRLKKHARAFLTVAFGGPNHYEGRDLRAGETIVVGTNESPYVFRFEISTE